MILGIYGAGGLGREVLDLARIINAKSIRWSNIVFIDDANVDCVISGIKIISFDVAKRDYSSDVLEIAIAVGEPQDREKLSLKVTTAGFRLVSLIHPQSMVSVDSNLLPGTIVQYCVFVSNGSCIGENTYLQPFSTIGHDTTIGSNCVISSNAVIAGNCNVGNRVYVSLNVPVKEQTNIGDDTIIGIGSFVLNDIPNRVVAYGNPARPIKPNDSGRVFKPNQIHK